MELNQLRTFLTVAEEKHLTRAAERLYTSQPAVSAQLKALESFLGVPLFERTPKGMLLTPAGQTLLPQASAILNAARAMEDDARAIQGKVMGKLTIGVNSDFSFLRLPTLLDTLRQDYPGIQLSLINSMSATITTDIRKNTLDSGFFFGPCSSADLHIMQLALVNSAIVAPARWKDRTQHASIEELARLPWIYTTDQCPFYALKEALFENTELRPAKSVFVDTEAAIRDLIQNESGISLLRADDARKAEQEGWGVRWAGTTPSISLNIAVRANRLQEPLIQAWLKTLADCWNLNQNAAEDLELDVI